MLQYAQYMHLYSGNFGVDIGPKASANFARVVSECKTIFWNGPMGKYEIPEFSEGTKKIATAIADATTAGSITIVGGKNCTTLLPVTCCFCALLAIGLYC